MKHRCLPSICAGLFVVSVCGGAARACLNDRDSDSLANEAKKLPNVVRVVTGRFERNPPLFYQMRIERVQKEIALHPNQIGLYDDVAVAYDRLGKDTDAIAWIEKKRGELGNSSWKTASPNVREAWYRYYANVGTFRIHRWIKNGADRAKLSQVVRARDEIARAIQIKPDAHFNRERYQLAVMNWLLNPQEKGNDGQLYTSSFGEYLSSHAGDLPRDTAAQVEGVSGLIVLGAAWESVDIYDALTQTLFDANRINLAYFSVLRAAELRKRGRKSLVSGSQSLYTESRLDMSHSAELLNPDEVKTKFHALRREADAWQKERTSYLIAGLRAGRHPDTDTHFWDKYRASTSPPTLVNPSDALNAQKQANYKRDRKRNATLMQWSGWILAGVLLAFIALIVGLAKGLKWAARRLAARV